MEAKQNLPINQHPPTANQPSTPTPTQIALREVAHLMLQDPASLQGLAEAFHKLDPQGTGRVPFAVAAAELRDGEYDLSDSEVWAAVGLCG